MPVSGANGQKPPSRFDSNIYSSTTIFHFSKEEKQTIDEDNPVNRVGEALCTALSGVPADPPEDTGSVGNVDADGAGRLLECVNGVSEAPVVQNN